MPIFRREPPLIGASNAGGVSKNAILDRWPYRLLRTLRQLSVIHTAAPDRGKLVTLIAGERRHLLFAGDDDEVFMTRSLNVTPKTTKYNLLVRAGKSEAAITNNKRLLEVLYY